MKCLLFGITSSVCIQLKWAYGLSHLQSLVSVEHSQWVSFKKTSLLGYIRKMLLYAILPSTGIAAALFYLGSNPPCGSQRDCLEARSEMPDAEDGGGNTTDTGGDGLIDGLFRGGGGRYDSPSVAWWILFIGVRQVITLSLAMMIETIVIDWWVLRAKSASQILGPYLSLFIVQAKGWPIRFVFWGLLDIGMLYGDRPFARHWYVSSSACAGSALFDTFTTISHDSVRLGFSTHLVCCTGSTGRMKSTSSTIPTPEAMLRKTRSTKRFWLSCVHGAASLP